MDDVKSFREILSRGFATVESDPTTGRRKETVVNGSAVVTGFHFLAEFEIDNLVDALRATVANRPQKN